MYIGSKDTGVSWEIIIYKIPKQHQFGKKNILLLNAVKEKKQLRLSRFQDLSDVILVLGKNNIIYALPIHGETLIYFFMYFKKLMALAFFRKAR